MDAEELETYLQENIPLSEAMAVEAVESSPERVVLAAPLEPNTNHRGTVFGGSASALAILAAWSVIRLALSGRGIECRLVIHRNTMTYTAPMDGRFTATSAIDPDLDWDRLARGLTRRGRARIKATATIECGGVETGRLVAEFVAIRDAAPSPSASATPA